MKKTFRCYVNLDGFEKTKTGRRKVWRTDAIPTHCCSLDVSFFIWEKATFYNCYEPYNGYVSPKHITFIDEPPTK